MRHARTRAAKGPPRGAPAPADRQAMLAKVHIARKELRLEEDSYRDVLRRITGADSAGKLTVPQLDAVLGEFRRLGWKAPAPARASGKPQVRMIMGVWKDLQGFVSDGSEAALRAFVQRQTKSPAHPDGVAAPEFLDSTQANRVLEGLKGWLARERAKATTAAAGAA